MKTNKHIWEGWTIQDFINELEFTFKYKTFKDKQGTKEISKHKDQSRSNSGVFLQRRQITRVKYKVITMLKIGQTLLLKHNLKEYLHLELASQD